MNRAAARLIGPLLSVLLVAWLDLAAPAWAGPVDWQEVPASDAGRQWWDAGSLRWNREGHLSVLSRFQPAPPPGDPQGARPPRSDLYVMEIDCDLELWRDTSVNGLPQFGAQWQSGAEDLLSAVIQGACAAAPPRA